MVFKSKKKIYGFSYLKVFLLILLLIIIFSLIQRSINLYSASSFRSDTFTVFVKNRDSFIIHTNTKTKNISFIEIPHDFPIDENLNKYELSYIIGIPVDAKIKYVNEKKISDTKTDLLSLRNFIKLISEGNNVKYTDSNKLDLIKLIFLSNYLNYEVEVFEKSKNMLDDKKSLGSILKDTTIIEEQLSIEVINGTGITGFGAKTAEMLRKIGVNIVSVKSDKVEKSRATYNIGKSYTLKRLQRIFPIEFEKHEDVRVADITILLGNDFARKYNIIE